MSQGIRPEACYGATWSRTRPPLGSGALGDPSRGRMLKYKILKRLGAGGMGEVYLAHDAEGDRDVAVKILQPQYSASSESRERFLREMKINAELDHPHIIRVFDYGESEGTLFFVMQYVQGQTLKEVVDQGPMDVHDAVDRVEEIAGALAYIHPRELIHRDLKPANIMLDTRGKAILLDFGLVKALAEVSLTTTGKVIGTPRYMAPEMMLTGKVDLRSDLYQLGCIFYELCTGVHAVPGKTRKEVAERSLYEVPRAPTEINPEIDPDLANLVLNCLEKNPAERYPDAPTLLADIQAYKEGKPVVRTGSGKPARERPRPRGRTQGQARVAPAGPPPAAPGPPPARRPTSGSTASQRAVSSSTDRPRVSGSSSLPPAPPGRGASLTGSLETRGMTLSADMLPAGAPLRRPQPRPENEIGPEGRAAGRQALLVGGGLTLVLVGILAVSLLRGPAFEARNLAVRALYAGADVSWESARAYPSRVEAWTDPATPRVFASEERGGLLHRVELRGLTPGRRVHYRVLFPDGTPGPEGEFEPLDLKPGAPRMVLKGAFLGQLDLDLGEVPVRVAASLRPSGAGYDSRQEWTRHEIPVELPGDGESVRVKLEAFQGPERRVELMPEVAFPGLKERVRALLDAPPGGQPGLWKHLVGPLREYFGDHARTDPLVKAWIFEALGGLRDRAARERAEGGDPGLDPDLALPRNFRPGDGLPGARSFPLQVEGSPPMIAFTDQAERASASRVHQLAGSVRGVPAGAANARGAAFAMRIPTVPREPSVLRIMLGNRITLSLYFGDPRATSETLAHSFDPRLLGTGGDLPVRLTFESLTGRPLGARGSLIVQDLELQILF